MPSITKVEADYEDENIAMNIQKYSGTVWICIYDVDGNLVSSIADTITKMVLLLRMLLIFLQENIRFVLH